MSVSALPWERKPSEMCIEIYIEREKNIPNLIDCNLKQDYQILKIFGTNISGTTGY